MKHWLFSAVFVLVVNIFSFADEAVAQAQKLRIGVTLPAYYSWLVNIVMDKAEVIPLLPASADPHSYQPRPDDLLALSRLDVLISNGLGHDAFIDPMLRALDSTHIKRIDPNQNVPLLPVYGTANDAGSTTAWNSHSFLSITSAVQQIRQIADQLGRLDPDNNTFYLEHARSYTKKLRQLLATTLAELSTISAVEDVKLATVHDGYAYLFQDLGLKIDSVVQPRHGIDPTPKQIADTIKRLKANRVQVLFTEIDYGKRFTEMVGREAGVKTVQLDHIASGPYTKEKFETAMQYNMQQIVMAINSYARQ